MARLNRITVGAKHGRLTILTVPQPPVGQQKCLCRCDCGVIKAIANRHIVSGGSKSCGCLSRDVAAKRNRTHGEGNTRKGTSPEFRTWQHMLRRCYTTNVPEYGYYGGRGISVCDKWRHDYSAFLTDMGRRPSREHSIDRIDVNGNYEPGNCRWATRVQQANNKRCNVRISAFGRIQPLQMWLAETGVTDSAFRGRMQRGWSIERALTAPTR